MPTLSPKAFISAINKQAKKVPAEKVLEVQKKVALQLYSDITVKTPVDTGRARASWSIFINEGKSKFDAGDVGGRGAAGAINKANSAKIKSATPFGLITISNTLPYISALENGHSQQAPRGMVRLSLNRLSLNIKDIINAV